MSGGVHVCLEHFIIIYKNIKPWGGLYMISI